MDVTWGKVILSATILSTLIACSTTTDMSSTETDTTMSTSSPATATNEEKETSQQTAQHKPETLQGRVLAAGNAVLGALTGT